jgi:hypothetical protein
MLYNHARQLVSAWTEGSPSLCPACEAALVPRRGDFVRWHWAHYPTVHDRMGCAYEESLWHLRWKEVYLGMGWQVEVPVVIKDQRFIMDAMNPRTGRMREFVHSLSDRYLAKHARLLDAGYDILWIFDGAQFMSERRVAVRKGGQRKFLKPLAYTIAQCLNVLVHDHAWFGREYHTLWREWKSNVWFPMTGEKSGMLLGRYYDLVYPKKEAAL